MTIAVTKESLAARIADLESGARSLKEDYTLAAYKMLLATMEAEPVCFVSERNIATLTKYRAAVKVKADPVMVRPIALYRHAQPAPVVEREPIAWLNDAYLARGVVDGEAGSEDAGPGYITVYREAGPQPAPVVPEEKPIPNTLSMYAVDAVAAIAEVKGWNACRAAMLAAAPQEVKGE